MKNIVYIATSLDGYIEDKNGKLDWLHDIPNPDGDDFGFGEFLDSIDAIVMGNNTFKMVDSFDCDWPYTKPVFVLSHSCTGVPTGYEGKVEYMNGTPREITKKLNDDGYGTLYIDGGQVVQSFLKEDMVDILTVTKVPVVLGGGIPLFGALKHPLKFDLVETDIKLNQMVTTTYKRKR